MMILVISGNDNPLHVVLGDSTSPSYVTANITIGK